MVCAECGAVMVFRTNKSNGRKFYGCVTYPQCRHTEPYTGKEEPANPNPSFSGDPDKWPPQLRTDQEIAREAIRRVDHGFIGNSSNVNERVLGTIHNWITKHKSEMLDDWDELRQKDWAILLLMVGFEAGRQFQREHPEEET